MNPAQIVADLLALLGQIPAAIQAYETVKSELSDNDVSKVEAAKDAAGIAGNQSADDLRSIPDDPA